MKSLIIYAHPWDGSFNHFVLETVKENLMKKGNKVDIIDLNKDNFNPVMQAEDLKVFVKGEYYDKQALDYVNRLKDADELVLVFPIWWYGEPAILKGFYDKVLLKGTTYDDSSGVLEGLLQTKKATIITTANIDKKIFTHLGDPIKNVLSNGILRTIGVNDISWIHCPTVHLESSREHFLNEINEHFNN